MQVLIFTLISLALCAGEGIRSCEPTVQDFIQLQTYLADAERPELDFIKRSAFDRYCRIRQFKFLDVKAAEVPSLQLEVLNTTSEDKRFCIITYSSWNKPYRDFPERLKQSLYHTSYQGHFLYQIGGWPYVKEGGLCCFDVPYAFKVCMFQEARKLGYQYVLWLDVAVIPLVNLENIFKELQHNQAIFLVDRMPFREQRFFQYTSDIDSLAKVLHSTRKKLTSCKHLNGKLIGLDLSCPENLNFLDEWYALAQSKLSFYSPVPEELPLSYLVQKQRLSALFYPEEGWFYKHFKLQPH